MKNNFVFFLGLFAALWISYAGIVLGSNAQLGSLSPYYDDSEGSTFPQWFPGVAARGQLVYRDLGCAACHTQQVRRPGFGSDQARGWGDRQSVARDYIYQPSPQLGLSRIGPDLANVGDRKPTAPDADDLLHLIYAGSEGMPSYRFLFEMRRIGNGAQPSDDALKLTGALEPKAGWEVVPTQRAHDLAGYLVNLKTTYDYPEAVPLAPAKPEGAAAPAKTGAAAPAATGAAPVPGAAAPASTGAAPAAGAAPAPAGAPAPAAANPAAPAPAGAPTASPTGTAAPAPTSPVAPAPAGAAPPAPAGTAAPAAPDAQTSTPTGTPTPKSAGGTQ